MSVTRKIFLFVGLPLIVALAVVIGWAFQESSPTSNNPADTSEDKNTVECEAMVAPVDVSLATSILYPGQERGGDYKPHGGFRFDSSKNDEIVVKAPLAAAITQGSRYLELGEVQYMFEFKTDCGLEYRFDHLQTLSEKLQALANTLPEAKPDDSRTTRLSGQTVETGELIATAVGHLSGEGGKSNVSLDFGVYDRRNQNEASRNPAWAAQHANEKDYAYYAVCWFDLLPSADAAIVKALPGSGIEAKTSDYCR